MILGNTKNAQLVVRQPNEGGFRLRMRGGKYQILFNAFSTGVEAYLDRIDNGSTIELGSFDVVGDFKVNPITINFVGNRIVLKLKDGTEIFDIVDDTFEYSGIWEILPELGSAGTNKEFTVLSFFDYGDEESAIEDYVPDIYDGVYEMQVLVDAENEIFDKALHETKLLSNNQFIVTADLDGIKRFEDSLNIVSNDNDTIADRRNRVLLRLYTREPFTMHYLNNLLNEITNGESSVEYSTNPYYNFSFPIITVRQGESSQNIWEDVSNLIKRMSPLNVVLEFAHDISFNMKINETVTSAGTVFNYRLGDWKLGEKPFITEGEEVVVKMPIEKSLNMEYFRNNALGISVDPILFNDGADGIYDPEEIERTFVDGVLKVKYTLPETITHLSKIQLSGPFGVVISEVNLDLPIYGTTIMEHTIQLEEGV